MQGPEKRVEGASKELNRLPASGVRLRKECCKRADRFSTRDQIRTARLRDLAREIAEMVINRVNDQISLGPSLCQCEAQQRLRLR